MTTYVDECDLDAAKPLRALVWKVVRTQFAAKIQYKCRNFLVLCVTPGTVPPRVVVFDSLRVMTAKILENAVKLCFGSDSCLHHCWTVRHTA